jgi:thiamine kinase-like enzyme
VKVVKRASEHIQILLPDTYSQILETLTDAQEHYARLPQERPTFTHSDFKADHLLFTPGGLTLIDFDTCTLTDPALDLGKFLADLEWWFTRKRISGVEEAQAQLLQGYMGQDHVDQDVQERLRRARLFQVLILVKIAARRAPLHKKDWAGTTTGIVKRAAEALHKQERDQYPGQ